MELYCTILVDLVTYSRNGRNILKVASKLSCSLIKDFNHTCVIPSKRNCCAARITIIVCNRGDSYLLAAAIYPRPLVMLRGSVNHVEGYIKSSISHSLTTLPLILDSYIILVGTQTRSISAIEDSFCSPRSIRSTAKRAGVF